MKKDLVPDLVFRVNTLGKQVDIWGWERGKSGQSGQLGVARDEYLVFQSLDAMPRWMQEKLAVLSTLDPDKQNEHVPNVGARVSRHIYWVYPDPADPEQTGDALAEYAREVGKTWRS